MKFEWLNNYRITIAKAAGPRYVGSGCEIQYVCSWNAPHSNFRDPARRSGAFQLTLTPDTSYSISKLQKKLHWIKQLNSKPTWTAIKITDQQTSRQCWWQRSEECHQWVRRTLHVLSAWSDQSSTMGRQPVSHSQPSTALVARRQRAVMRGQGDGVKLDTATDGQWGDCARCWKQADEAPMSQNSAPQDAELPMWQHRVTHR